MKSNHDIKCPNCQTLFTIDQNGYSSIVEQVTTQEFKQRVDDLDSLLLERMNRHFEYLLLRITGTKEKLKFLSPMQDLTKYSFRYEISKGHGGGSRSYRGKINLILAYITTKTTTANFNSVLLWDAQLTYKTTGYRFFILPKCLLQGQKTLVLN